METVGLWQEPPSSRACHEAVRASLPAPGRPTTEAQRKQTAAGRHTLYRWI